MAVNRGHKSSVFSLLFSDPEALRALYGALEGVAWDRPLPGPANPEPVGYV
jgi:hypothetical protein